MWSFWGYSCDHEEADTRIPLHLYDAVQQGATNIVVRTVDTDIIVILVGLFFDNFFSTNIWVAFGTGKYFRYYSINSICNALGEEKSRALPFFHSLTGCDTTSQFHGKAKKSAWDAWTSYPAATAAFAQVMSQPFVPLSIQSELFETLEWFICVLYDKTTDINSVNDMRQELFSRHSKLMENIPPTQVMDMLIKLLCKKNINFVFFLQAALLQHCNRAVYQCSIWSRSLQNMQNPPTPDAFGWKKGGMWIPLWTDLPEAAKASRELLKCGCKAIPLCTRKCRCKAARLSCTGLCHCGGHCEDTE